MLKKKNRSKRLKLAPGIASDAELRRRNNSVNPKVGWLPTISALNLPQVPAEAQERIRTRLAPWLANLKHADGTHRIGVHATHCWEVAQRLAMTAKAEDVKYVEGVWAPLERKFIDGAWVILENQSLEPVPHGWVTVEGYIVDLLEEYHRYLKNGGPRAYETLQVYPHEKLVGIYDGSVTKSCSVCVLDWLKGEDAQTLPEHYKKGPTFSQVAPPSDQNPNGLWGTPEELGACDEWLADREEYISAFVFKPAVDRLRIRHQ